MVKIENFGQMEALLAKSGKTLRIAVACGTDASTQVAVGRLLASGLVRATFVGGGSEVAQSEALRPCAGAFSMVEAADAQEAVRKAVAEVREGRADVLMKGLVNTDVLLRAVLDKERGLLRPGRVLTHLAVAQVAAYEKLLFFSDSAVIPYPTHEQRCAQVACAARVLHALGVEEPRISLIHCSEKVGEKFPHTMGYADIRERADKGEWGRLRVDGPLDVRTSCDPVACAVKGISSSLEGRADVLIFPDIEAGNTFYKTLSFLAGGSVAGMLCGADCPVVLPSRGDDAEAKYNSLLLALTSLGAAAGQ